MNALRPYHQLMGNGIDAVLLGPTGAMSPDAAAGLDRCYWYKSDLYYPDARRFAPGDDPRAFLAAPPGGTNCQLAPLGRTWYEVLDSDGVPLRPDRSSQHFETSSAVLHTTLHLGDCRISLRTWLAPDGPALLFDLQADNEVTIRAGAGAGLWPQDTEQTEPTSGLVPLASERTGWRFSVGTATCLLYLVPVQGATLTDPGVDGRDAWVQLRGSRLRWWAILETDRYPGEAETDLRLPADPPPAPSATSPAVDVPDADFAQLHDFSMYMFRGMQHRYSGGLPVNNLRRTFNSHVFWDGAFVQRALLEAGYVDAAREAWRFLDRTRAMAAANARATFGSPGLHWDWETTHTGERAYIPWLQQRFQVHNTPLLAHMILADYRATRDRAVLEEGYDLLAGAATFLLHSVLVADGPLLVTRPLVGSHEAPTRVVNDGATVADGLRLLADLGLAARLLGRDDPLVRRSAAAAHRLRATLGRLFNGRYFQASSDEDRLNTSSLAPIYPADVVAPTDARAIATALSYRRRYAGRMAGHGNNDAGFPWSAGVLARILAYQGRGADAWEQLDLSRPALCAQGGCAEYVDDNGRWNMQYFSTAQAALCSALHALLVQQHGAELRLFPALPAAWDACAFRGFLFAGIGVDASYRPGSAHVALENRTDRPRTIALRFGRITRRCRLDPGARQELALRGGA